MEGTLRSVMHSQRPRLTLSACLALVLVGAAVALIAYYAPEDADQGLSQKIFYFHVPIALTAYACFGWAAWKAFRHLSRRQAGADLESYVAVHIGVIFGVLTLATGSIWARISWGVWWTWGSDQLVLFLVLFLFYCAYMMLRFSVADGPQRANLCAVYALFGVVLIPVSFSRSGSRRTSSTRLSSTSTVHRWRARCCSRCALRTLPCSRSPRRSTGSR